MIALATVICMLLATVQQVAAAWQDPPEGYAVSATDAARTTAAVLDEEPVVPVAPDGLYYEEGSASGSDEPGEPSGSDDLPGKPIAFTKRLGGKSRIETAILASQAGWPKGAENVILANSQSYADALAGVPLSEALDAPILLTGGSEAEDAVAEEIERLGAERVFLLGGGGVMSGAYEKQLGAGRECIRLSGATRFETAAAVANAADSVRQSMPKNIFLVSSKSFADALAAGSAAAVTGGVILYVEPGGTLDAGTADFIRTSGCEEIYIAGGSAAVSTMVFASLREISDARLERIGGSDRYDTALKICRRFDDSFTGKSAVAATGAGFADALSGGALAARFGSPLILVSNASELEGIREYIAARRTNTLYVMGGVSVISDYTVSQIIETPQNTTKPTAATTTGTQPELVRVAYLTFDDGPSDNTDKLLDILKEEGVKATFFVIHREGCDEKYRRILREGHSLGIHSYTHDYDKVYAGEKAFYGDLDGIASFVAKVTGVRPKIMRFPGGSNSKEGENRVPGIMAKLRKGVTAAGYSYFDWNVYTGDASALHVPKDTIVENAKRAVWGQDELIVLMHDSPAKTTTVEALPEIIDYLREQGYEFASLNENTPPIHNTD